MSRTEVHQYDRFTVRYQGDTELEEASEAQAQDFIDRGVEEGKNREDFEMVEEQIVEIVPPPEKPTEEPA